jgi:hypothetical protein
MKMCETFEHAASCHGKADGMAAGSVRMRYASLLRKVWRVKNLPINTLYHLRTKGAMGTLKLAVTKMLKAFGIKPKVTPVPVPPDEEVLNLRSGECVEIKSEQEILATLDGNRRYKGLYFMGGMRNFCGQRVRVYKRAERILLESTEELRKMKHTVLLEGVVCDGEDWGGCDRSCFYYWREAWLRRAKQDQ